MDGIPLTRVFDSAAATYRGGTFQRLSTKLCQSRKRVMNSLADLPVVLEPSTSVHALSEQEKRAEQAVLAGIAQHFATFAGTRREAYDAMTAMTPLAAGVACEEVATGTVRGWWVRPVGARSDRAILFVHGGAYMLGSAAAYRGLASQITARTGVSTFVLDYPLAPEHPFPAAYDTSVEARRWMRAQGVARIALVGDSAGGGLVLSTLAQPVDESSELACVVVFSPWTDLAMTGASMTDPQVLDPIFQFAALAGAAVTYLGGSDPKDPRASPLYGLPDAVPPLLVQVGADELLLDDARRYAALAAQRGGEVRLQVFEGLHHVFQRACANLPSARRALDDAAAFIAAHWQI